VLRYKSADRKSCKPFKGTATMTYTRCQTRPSQKDLGSMVYPLNNKSMGAPGRVRLQKPCFAPVRIFLQELCAAPGRVCLQKPVLHLCVSVYKSFVLHLDVAAYKSLFCTCACLSTRALCCTCMCLPTRAQPMLYLKVYSLHKKKFGLFRFGSNFETGMFVSVVETNRSKPKN
jgi:hypothetical protein